MEKVANRLKELYQLERVYTCYMSLLGPHFPEILEKVVQDGCKNIMVIPYLLNNGLHIVFDIPHMMKHEAEKYPDVKLKLGQNLGYDDSLVELVHKRIQQSVDSLDIRDVEIPPRKNFPVPDGQYEFVEMTPEDAEEYKKHSGHGHHHH